MSHTVRNAALGVFAAAASLSGGSALATGYDFTYIFAGDGTGNTITGSFDGTGPVNDITGISDIHMALNGNPLSGPFYAYSYTPTSPNCGAASCFTLGGAVVSGDSSLSNFLFSSAATNAGLATSNYFYVIQPWSNPPGQTIAAQYAFGGSPNNAINGYNGQYVAANFSVSAPEPAAWALMLVGFAGLGAAFRARRAAVLTA